MIFLYAQSVIYNDFNLSKTKIIHFLPFAILFTASGVSYLALGQSKQIIILKSIVNRKIPFAVYIVSCIIYFQFFAYLYSVLQLVKKYRAAAVNQFSEAERVTLSWLKTTVYFFLVLMIVSAVNSYLSFRSNEKAYFFVLSLTIFLLLLFIVFVLFKALRNPEIFSFFEKRANWKSSCKF